MQLVRHEDGSFTSSSSGGVIRVTHGATEEPQIEQLGVSSGTLVSGTTYRTNHATGQTEAVGRATYNAYEDRAAANNSGSVMSTLQKIGGNETVELVPGNPNSRTLLSVAASEGLIAKLGESWVDASVVRGLSANAAPAAAPQVQSQAQEQVPQGDPANYEGTIFPRDNYSIWSAEVGKLNQQSFDSAVAGTIAAIATQNDGKIDGVVNALAQEAGIEPELAREYVEAGQDFYADSVARDLVKHAGMTRDQAFAMFDKLAETGHPKLTQAMLEVAHEGRADTFREIARDYKIAKAKEMEPFLGQLRAVGFQTSIDGRTGDVMLRRGDGPWIAWSEYVKHAEGS